MTLNTQLDLTAAAKITLQCMDLTSLTGSESDDEIRALCQQANNSAGHTAAICIYPQYIEFAKTQLNSDVKIATVTNFPHGDKNIDKAVSETKQAVSLGADEVDVVFPYRALIDGDETLGFELVKQCKVACGDTVLLKVIIESGELKSDELIASASRIAIDAGADFIKTSTGKVPVNATLNAAKIMLETIKASGKQVGFKAAGGVRTVADAKQYIELAASIFDLDWVNPANFRFGASGLLGDVKTVLQINTSTDSTQGDY
ncbi:MAG: deoxyribose-phosphate aldolase [Pseudoalteromonas spongiae]